MPQELKGFSLTRPWPFAFTNSDKRIDNRDWQPKQSALGQWVALHSAKSWSESDRQFISRVTGLNVPGISEFPHSEIFAVCRLAGIIQTSRDPRLLPDQHKWFFGIYAHLFDEFLTLKHPVACAGKPGYFRLDEKVIEEVRLSYRESKTSANLFPAFVGVDKAASRDQTIIELYTQAHEWECKPCGITVRLEIAPLAYTENCGECGGLIEYHNIITVPVSSLGVTRRQTSS